MFGRGGLHAPKESLMQQSPGVRVQPNIPPEVFPQDALGAVTKHGLYPKVINKVPPRMADGYFKQVL